MPHIFCLGFERYPEAEYAMDELTGFMNCIIDLKYGDGCIFPYAGSGQKRSAGKVDSEFFRTSDEPTAEQQSLDSNAQAVIKRMQESPEISACPQLDFSLFQIVQLIASHSVPDVQCRHYVCKDLY